MRCAEDKLRDRIIRSTYPAAPAPNFDMAKWGLMVGGGSLALVGLAQRSLVGLLVASAGGYLAWRGYEQYRLASGYRTGHFDNDPIDPTVERNDVDEASWESFPASDSPTHMSTTAWY